MTIRLSILMPLVFGLTAVWMSGVSQAAPQGGKVTPTLTVAVSPSTIAEGQTATGTVSRVNASLTSAVLVTLTSNDTSEATVTASVTIPMNASSTKFTVTGVNDGTGDGAKAVTITAAATGFKSGSVNVTAASPALPPVGYRVQLIPISNGGGFNLQDSNDSREVVGWFNTIEGNKGFYYNAASRVYLTATDMLPSLTGSTQFIGINNLGWIVGSLADSNGLRSGILIYPSTTSTSGWSYEVVPGPVNAYEYYPRDINDLGDIVGAYWRRNADGTQGRVDAFAYNPGVPLLINPLAPTPFGLAEAQLYSIQVSNQGRGLAVEVTTGAGWWFDFETNSVEPVVVPVPYYINVTGNGHKTLSNDDQLAVARIASTTKVRGGYTYTYRPGVVRNGVLVWEGIFEGQTLFVNSAVSPKLVGDAVGRSNGFQTQWLQHADWGKLDIESMLVFDSLLDQERWLLGDPYLSAMSDRDLTGFGMVTGILEEIGGRSLFVLMPEKIIAP